MGFNSVFKGLIRRLKG